MSDSSTRFRSVANEANSGPSPFDLSAHGIVATDVLRNPDIVTLYEAGIQQEQTTTMSDRAALIAYSGQKTGRSPRDKHIVREPNTEQDVWWGKVNLPIEEAAFAINREQAINYLNGCPRLFVLDGYAGWDPRYQIKVRVIGARPYHCLFMRNMLIRPTPEQLTRFDRPDFVIFNAGSFPAISSVPGLRSKTSIDLNLNSHELVIMGTEYAGEMKKGLFTYMNYRMPAEGILSMHCSATYDRQRDESAILFGLSGTGKTTLSSDPARQLVGDDEHCWTDEGIFNIEGGCYAKLIRLRQESEPQIYDALRFGAVLENVVYNPSTHQIDFDDDSITENTRGAYPIEFIQNARIPCSAGPPKDVIFLTCDAFGILPPVSHLTDTQAQYHFINGYTAKIAGTEVGVTQPEATFSPCFGGPFLVWHPAVYARLLAQRVARAGARVWLINTGWTGGPHGVGRRISLTHTRSILHAVYDGKLNEAPTREDPLFGLHAVVACPDVPSELLWPRDSWTDRRAYDAMAKKLAAMFHENFQQYVDSATPEVAAAGP